MPLLVSSHTVGNVFFYGSFVIGPDWHYMIASGLLISLGSMVFVIYTNTVLAARVIVGIMGTISLGLLTLCGFANPGICRKQPPPPPDAPSHDSMWEEADYVKSDGTAGRVRYERRWCYSCNIYRPYRSVHCRFCDVCITRRDHHCPWTGMCIGSRNYAAYYAFVMSVFILNMAGLIGGIQSFVHRVSVHAKEPKVGNRAPSSFMSAMLDTYCLEMILIVVCGLWAFLTASLLTLHTYLISQNMTTGDYTKGHAENIFYRGNMLANAKEALCSFGSTLYGNTTEVCVEAAAAATPDEPDVLVDMETPNDDAMLCGDESGTILS